MRPVELTLVPDSVSTFEDVANALTRACEVCTLLSNQRRLMKNTFFLRASLITHLVTRVSTRGLALLHGRIGLEGFGLLHTPGSYNLFRHFREQNYLELVCGVFLDILRGFERLGTSSATTCVECGCCIVVNVHKCLQLS